MDDLQVFRKIGTELTDGELLQLNGSMQREFQTSLPPKEKLSDRLFFLLKNEEVVVAFGALIEVNPVLFEGKEYSLHGFVNVVANEKGKGYGKRVITAMKEYLVANDLAGFGFCSPKNREFYEKCGLQINTEAVPRFVYKKDGRHVTNQDGQFLFYLDSSTRFLSTILTGSEREIILPTSKIW